MFFLWIFIFRTSCDPFGNEKTEEGLFFVYIHLSIFISTHLLSQTQSWACFGLQMSWCTALSKVTGFFLGIFLVQYYMFVVVVKSLLPKFGLRLTRRKQFLKRNIKFLKMICVFSHSQVIIIPGRMYWFLSISAFFLSSNMDTITKSLRN